MKYTYASLDALLKAFQGGELYGYAPSESYDARSFQFPVEVSVNELEKSFTITQSPAKLETAETLNAVFKENTPKNRVWVYFALAAGVVVIISAIVVAFKVL